MTRLIIVRHAESALNLQNRIQGHRDSGLTAKGLRQARRLARRLKAFKIHKIYSSDLGRAYATTLEIARHTRAPVVRDPLLREIHLGDWEGMTPEEVDRLYQKGYQRWLKKPSAIIIPRAERVGHFRKRVTERVRAIARANWGKTVLLVTHGGVITALLADWLKADFDNILLNLQIDNTGVTFAEVIKGRVRHKASADSSKRRRRSEDGFAGALRRIRIQAINDTAHLGERKTSGFTVFNKRA